MEEQGQQGDRAQGTLDSLQGQDVAMSTLNGYTTERGESLAGELERADQIQFRQGYGGFFSRH